MINKFRIRIFLQAVFLIVAVTIVLKSAHFIAHRYCPYAVVCFGIRGLNPNAIFTFVSAIIGGVIILLSTLFWGRRFCGYICPLGTIAEYLHYLNPFRRRVFKKRVPHHIDRVLRSVKYLILILTALFAFLLLGYLYFQICPVMLATGSESLGFWSIFAMMAIVIGCIFIKRFWCRYLCTYASLMNCFQFLGSKIGIKRSVIHRNLEVCNDCRCCEYNCQMNIDITDQEFITDSNCIFCLNCLRICPKEKCLTMR